LSFRLGMTQTTDNPARTVSQPEVESTGFTEIGVSGFKSFAEETRIRLGSLTILAGANSSGKSSIMQPLLLMKQTLEASYDPGALLLDGPNASYTSGEQILTKSREANKQRFFGTYISTESAALDLQFRWSSGEGINIEEQSFRFLDPPSAIFKLSSTMTPQEIFAELKPLNLLASREPADVRVKRSYCFLGVDSTYGGFNPSRSFGKYLCEIIHVQGLRGNPVRSYKTTAVSGSDFTNRLENYFKGQFEIYVASIIDRFQKENPEQLIKIQEALRKLGLTDIVQTQRLNDTQIELRVGRVLGQADPTDTVNIADVGFGVSQVLPVIVALLVAQPGQLVYIEQPEIHLHPRAQIALSEIFADAANRGVRVVVETHSELFLLGIQSLVAEDKLDPKEVKLHWFTRNPDGSSKVTSAELDTTGAFGDWPQDFGMTALALENRYLSAAEAKLWNAGNGRSHN
jgi:AAA15 family ATPase/GTPase